MSTFVKKIKFSDGTIRYVYDTGAARKEDLDNYLPLTGGTITGDIVIQGDTTFNSLTIDDIEWIDPETVINNVLVHDENNKISKRSTDTLLKDIGGVSCSIDDTNGILKFNVGKSE